jgi:2-methylisocitrate lyase-like PEP mutase family enzyme
MRADDATFQRYHALKSRFSVIAEAWDLLSAIVIEKSGLPAVGTTSVGLGFALGCPGDVMVSKDEMLAVVRSICAAVSIPVCVDLESGYADTAEGVETVVAAIIDAGAVGFNIEDSIGIPGKALRSPEEHAERIRACRRAADRAGASLYIVGRTDSFWLRDDNRSDNEKATESIRRANLYAAAGANAVFISGRSGIARPILERLVREIDVPVNSLIGGKELSVADFEAIGIRTLHTGSLGTRAQVGLLQKALAELKENRMSLWQQMAIPTPAINDMVRPVRQRR